MTQPDSYPDHWRPPHLRRADAEAQRRIEDARAVLEQDTLNRATGGDGHLANSPRRLAGSDDYPNNWDTKGTDR